MYYGIKGTNVRLMGSLHMVPADQPAMPWFVTNAYEWCEQIAFEHDNASLDMRWIMTLPEGETLVSKIPAQLFAKIKAVWPDTHRLGMLRNQSLFMVATGLSLGTMQLVAGVETVLTSRAKVDGKPIKYLETPREFIEVARTIDDKQFFEIFEMIMSKAGQGEVTVRALHDAWSNYNIRGLKRYCQARSMRYYRVSKPRCWIGAMPSGCQQYRLR